MVRDEHEVTGGEPRAQRTRGVREHHHFASSRQCRAHGVCDLPRTVALVEMESAEKHEHASTRDLHGPHLRHLPAGDLVGEARQLCEAKLTRWASRSWRQPPTGPSRGSPPHRGERGP